MLHTGRSIAGLTCPCSVPLVVLSVLPLQNTGVLLCFDVL